MDIEINAGAIGGPSAGLAFALDIVDELGEDIDRGRKIVAIGELTIDGEVLADRGREAEGHRRARGGRRHLPRPDANYEDARKAVDDLARIIPVSTFDEALSVLAAN